MSLESPMMFNQLKFYLVIILTCLSIPKLTQLTAVVPTLIRLRPGMSIAPLQHSVLRSGDVCKNVELFITWVYNNRDKPYIDAHSILCFTVFII